MPDLAFTPADQDALASELRRVRRENAALLTENAGLRRELAAARERLAGQAVTA